MITYLYFQFAIRVVSEFKRINASFQATNADSKAEEQYRKILFHPWAEEISIFAGCIITQDIVQFCIQVWKFKEAVGNYVYIELAQHALTCLTTPASNAVVERIFSRVSNNKKTGNRLKIGMLDAIIRIKTVLLIDDKCCTHLGRHHKCCKNLMLVCIALLKQA